MRRLTALLLTPLLTTLAAAQAVHVVDSSGGGDFTGIQAAVNAAASGDTLLIKSGHYFGRTVIDGKGLKVVAELGVTDVEVIGGVTVRNLPADEVVALVRLRLKGRHWAGHDAEVGLEVDGCTGPVRVDGCTIRGDEGGFFSGSDDNGGNGVQVRACSDVALVGCKVRGGESGWTWSCGDGWDQRAGHGLVVTEGSLVTLHDCDVIAGDALNHSLDEIECGGQQGHGAWVTDSYLYGAGTHLQGGQGGSEGLCLISFPGGDGLRLEGGGAHADLLAMTLVGGPPSPCGDPPGQPLRLVSGATANYLAGSMRSLKVRSPVRAGQTVRFSVTGLPDEGAVVVVSPGAGWRNRIPWQSGPWMGGGPAHVITLGRIPPSGVITRFLDVPPIGSGLDSQTYFVQALVRGGGQSWLGSHGTLVVLDPQF